MTKNNIDKTVLSLVVILTIIFGLIDNIERIQFFFSKKIKTQGKVIEIIPDEGYTFMIEYYDKSGIKYATNNRYSTNIVQLYNVGDDVLIEYQESNPLNAIISDFYSKFLCPSISILIYLIILGALYVLKQKKWLSKFTLFKN